MQNYSQMKYAIKMTNNIIFKQMVLPWAVPTPLSLAIFCFIVKFE